MRDYADNLLIPHNILGWRVIEELEALAKTPPRWALFRPAGLELIGDLHTLDQADDWDKVIKELVKRGFKNQTLLIVLALHGGSDSEGAYLLPDKMARPEERLDLVHVIKSMGKLPPEKQKILVLEAAQVQSNWRLGMLHNDFARRLEGLEPEIRKVQNLWVLSAAGVDQRCWTSEGLGHTVFGHYLLEALRGQAAGRDGRLTLDQLRRYLSTNVRNWVWNAREAIQEPVLLPGGRRPSRSKGEVEGPKQSPDQNNDARRVHQPTCQRGFPGISRQFAGPEHPGTLGQRSPSILGGIRFPRCLDSAPGDVFSPAVARVPGGISALR